MQAHHWSRRGSRTRERTNARLALASNSVRRPSTRTPHSCNSVEAHHDTAPTLMQCAAAVVVRAHIFSMHHYLVRTRLFAPPLPPSASLSCSFQPLVGGLWSSPCRCWAKSQAETSFPANFLQKKCSRLCSRNEKFNSPPHRSVVSGPRGRGRGPPPSDPRESSAMATACLEYGVHC